MTMLRFWMRIPEPGHEEPESEGMGMPGMQDSS